MKKPIGDEKFYVGDEVKVVQQSKKRLFFNLDTTNRYRKEIVYINTTYKNDNILV